MSEQTQSDTPAPPVPVGSGVLTVADTANATTTKRRAPFKYRLVRWSVSMGVVALLAAGL